MAAEETRVCQRVPKSDSAQSGPDGRKTAFLQFCQPIWDLIRSCTIASGHAMMKSGAWWCNLVYHGIKEYRNLGNS
jgi:hypothetical protein